MTTTADNIRNLEAEHILQVYKRLPVVLTNGKGSRVFDTEGNEYIDLLSGIGVTALGHANPDLNSAIASQSHELLHTSNLFFNALQGEVAMRLSKLSGLSRTFFCNSGTEAVEACLKFARRHWHSKGDHERKGIIAFERSFHGRTFGSLSVTSGQSYREPFEPLLPDVKFVYSDNPQSLREAVSSTTAAIIIEPIQGEGGVWPVSREMANTITSICKETGTLLIADEVQCGLGRTGKTFFSESINLTPDLMALGKSLGAGVPIGATLLSESVADTVKFGDHGSTYGGNLLACRAALVFLDALENGLLTRINVAGAYLEKGLHSLAKNFSCINDIRGAGLIQGIEVEPQVAEDIVPAALCQGVIINRTAGSVIRLLPPLNITDEEIDEGLKRLGAAFGDIT
tara:strand:+ start:768 stop:1967 length:1200 start_codon:yes stop_codon:yes gene_type:complete